MVRGRLGFKAEELELYTRQHRFRGLQGLCS